MIIRNCKIVYLDKIEEGSIEIHNGKITKINPEIENNSDCILDAKGLYLAPGFIEIHTHGADGYDTMDGTEEAINGISSAIMKHGVTSFTPTTMTVSKDEIIKSLEVINKIKEDGSEGAQVIGAHLEGPFINIKALGAQNDKYVLEPCVENFKKITGNYENLVRTVTLSPEVNGAEELIKYLVEKDIVCSMGHTKASYEEAIKAIECGVSHSTHLYNAMTGLNHRNPGVVGATFDSDITTEMICDGIHLSYPAIRIAIKQKSANNICLISDSMMACCKQDGIYSLGGQKVLLKGERATLENGVLAGSVLTLDKAVKNVYKNTELPLYEVIKMASYNGAKHCRVNDRKGLIKEGYDADIILFDEDINIKKVFINGEEKI